MAGYYALFLWEIDGFVKSPEYLTLATISVSKFGLFTNPSRVKRKKYIFCIGGVFFLLTRPLMGDTICTQVLLTLKATYT